MLKFRKQGGKQNGRCVLDPGISSGKREGMGGGGDLLNVELRTGEKRGRIADLIEAH